MRAFLCFDGYFALGSFVPPVACFVGKKWHSLCFLHIVLIENFVE